MRYGFAICRGIALTLIFLTPVSAARLVDEGYEGAGFEDVWFELVGAGSTLDADATTVLPRPPGAGREPLQAITAGSDDGYALAVKVVRPQASNYVRAYLNLGSDGLGRDDLLLTLALMEVKSSDIVATVAIANFEGAPYALLFVKDGEKLLNSRPVPFSADRWHRVEYRYDLAKRVWAFRLDGEVIDRGTLDAGPALVVDTSAGGAGELAPAAVTLPGSPDAILTGVIVHAGSRKTTLYTDLLAWDGDEWPGEATLAMVSPAAWTEAAVHRVLHAFAYGGHASDAQVATWAGMAPDVAIDEILSFDCLNPALSPPVDATAGHCDIADLQDWWSGSDPTNLVRSDQSRLYSLLRRNADGTVYVASDGNNRITASGLQNTWVAAINKRGLNPVRQKVGLWLTNYWMAVTLRNIRASLLRAFYDDAISDLEQERTFAEVLATGAAHAAVARQYGHQNNNFNNSTMRFRGNDDFAREFHQLYFHINGIDEDPEYHEEVTIENTARALTGMRLDRDPSAYGGNLRSGGDQDVAPIVFTDHVDPAGRTLNNASTHHRSDLEVLHEVISGASAEQKMAGLANVAIEHPESIDVLPLKIVEHFADDNLTPSKQAGIRGFWERSKAKSLLGFLRAYAVSTTFHRSDTYKYRTAFNTNMTTHNLNTVDNEEAYANSFSPRTEMREQGADVFYPAHAVFGGQTGLDAANSPAVFKEAYNASVDNYFRLAKTRESYLDRSGATVEWLKDWARRIPRAGASHQVAEVGLWLWKRFIGDGGKHLGPIERAYVHCFLATGRDCEYQVDRTDPASVRLTLAELEQYAADFGENSLALDSNDANTRREANRRVGMAINFIVATPYAFVVEGR